MNKLSLGYPVTPFHINQGFGGNGAYYLAHGINIIGHNGLDLQAYHGQPIYAAHNGTCYVTREGNEGCGVVIVSDDKYDYQNDEVFFKTIYWHMVDGKKEPKWAIPVNENQKVKRGDLIGYADNTGLSTGDHLHFGLKPVAKFGEASFTTSNIAQNNGYQGAIDPLPYMNVPVMVDIPITPDVPAPVIPKPVVLTMPLRENFVSKTAYYTALFYYYVSKIKY